MDDLMKPVGHLSEQERDPKPDDSPVDDSRLNVVHNSALFFVGRCLSVALVMFCYQALYQRKPVMPVDRGTTQASWRRKAQFARKICLPGKLAREPHRPMGVPTEEPWRREILLPRVIHRKT